MIIFRSLGRQPYIPIWRAMQRFTDTRHANTQDEIWFLEHEPVYTQGMAGKPEHILNAQDIPVVDIDRGGQVTYHGPGQLVVYFMLDVARKKLAPRQLVTKIEQALIQLLAKWHITAHTRADAPGVYVNHAKIASLGLRIRQQASYHGLALNVDMDLQPFKGINPCGHAGMKIVQVRDFVPTLQMAEVKKQLKKILEDFDES